jgi:hypothetical protein
MHTAPLNITVLPPSPQLAGMTNWTHATSVNRTRARPTTSGSALDELTSLKPDTLEPRQSLPARPGVPTGESIWSPVSTFPRVI